MDSQLRALSTLFSRCQWICASAAVSFPAPGTAAAAPLGSFLAPHTACCSGTCAVVCRCIAHELPARRARTVAVRVERMNNLPLYLAPLHLYVAVVGRCLSQEEDGPNTISEQLNAAAQGRARGVSYQGRWCDLGGERPRVV